MPQIKPKIHITEKSSAILFLKIVEYFKDSGYVQPMKKRYPIIKFMLLKEIINQECLIDIIQNIVLFME
jgi:hypothetical protein